MSIPGLETEAALARAIGTQPEPVPCCATREPLWISDREIDRIRAARLCQPCPVIDLCRVAGEPHSAGVWGGIDRHRGSHADAAHRRAMVRQREASP